MRHKDKVVFIAGGTSGINLAIARAFAAEGARVAVASRSQDKVDAAVAELRTCGREPLGYSVDVRNFDGLATAIADIQSKFGFIDIVISGAAGNFPAPAAQMSANGFKSVVDIDLLGTFNVMRAVWPHLRKPGAAIINITALQSWVPIPNQVHVCAAKAGIDQITRTLALEWGPAGVRVNSIAPGPTAETEGMQRLAPGDAAVHELTMTVPLRRFGTKSEIAKAALWLCSDDASYITGVVLSVDGGLALSGSSSISSSLSRM